MQLLVILRLLTRFAEALASAKRHTFLSKSVPNSNMKKPFMEDTPRGIS